MDDVYLVGLAGIQRDLARVDRISINLANMTTPGFKREVAAAPSFADAVRAAGAPVGGSAGVAGSASPERPMPDGMRVLMDARPGALRQTGQPLDLALTATGFFEVSTPNGPAYTRQGNFHVDQNGRLVTAQGDAVMGTSGEIYLTSQKPSIDASGNITEPDAVNGTSVAGRLVAQLKIVSFEDPRLLQRIGGGLLVASQTIQTAPGLADSAGQVRQGALESANVDSMHEMVQLLQTMRHFESMQKVVQGYDELMGTAIRKLGDL